MATNDANPYDDDEMINDGDGLQPGGQEICIAKGVGAAISGGVMGGVFGLGSGLFQRKGLKVALTESGVSAKTFAVMSAVHSLVTCYMRKVRGREDAINAGIAGCATGLAIGWGGSPQAMLQGCVGFGAFSYLFDYLNPPPAKALSRKKKRPSRTRSPSLQQQSRATSPTPPFFVLPPFTLPPLSSIPAFLQDSALGRGLQQRGGHGHGN